MRTRDRRTWTVSLLSCTPVAVGLMGGTDAEIKAGFLHDVVEDSDLTLA